MTVEEIIAQVRELQAQNKWMMDCWSKLVDLCDAYEALTKSNAALVRVSHSTMKECEELRAKVEALTTIALHHEVAHNQTLEVENARLRGELEALQADVARLHNAHQSAHRQAMENGSNANKYRFEVDMLRGELEAERSRISEAPIFRTYVEETKQGPVCWLDEYPLPADYEGHLVALVRIGPQDETK